MTADFWFDSCGKLVRRKDEPRVVSAVGLWWAVSPITTENAVVESRNDSNRLK